MYKFVNNTRVYLKFYLVCMVGITFLSSEAHGFYPDYDYPQPPPYPWRSSIIGDDSCICPLYYDPICANNGKSYGNSCALNCARKKNRAIFGLCYGECPCCKPRYTENYDDFSPPQLYPLPYGSSLYGNVYEDDSDMPSNSSEMLAAEESKLKRKIPPLESKLDRSVPASQSNPRWNEGYQSNPNWNVGSQSNPNLSEGSQSNTNWNVGSQSNPNSSEGSQSNSNWNGGSQSNPNWNGGSQSNPNWNGGSQ